MPTETTIHASCVAVGDRAALIKGKSGSGKSALALQLMALGADLVADDRVILRRNDGLEASSPENLSGLIEARFLGILKAEAKLSAKVAFVIDLDRTEEDRLPKERKVTLLGCDVPLLYRIEGLHFAPAILQLLRKGQMAT